MKKKKKGVCRDFRDFFVIMFPSKDTSFGRVLHSTMLYLPAPGKPAALLPQESSTSDFPVFLFGNTSQKRSDLLNSKIKLSKVTYFSQVAYDRWLQMELCFKAFYSGLHRCHIAIRTKPTCISWLLYSSK